MSMEKSKTQSTPKNTKIKSEYLSGVDSQDLRALIRDTILEEAAANDDDFVNKSAVITLSGLPQSTAYQAIQEFELLFRQKGLMKLKGGRLWYHKRVGTFLARQAAYRKEYEVSFKKLLEDLMNYSDKELYDTLMLEAEDKGYIVAAEKYAAISQEALQASAKCTETVSQNIIELKSDMQSNLEKLNKQLEKIANDKKYIQILEDKIREKDDVIKNITKINKTLNQENNQLRNIIIKYNQAVNNLCSDLFSKSKTTGFLSNSLKKYVKNTITELIQTLENMTIELQKM